MSAAPPLAPADGPRPPIQWLQIESLLRAVDPESLPRIRAEVEAVDVLALERHGFITLLRHRWVEINVAVTRLPPGLWHLRSASDNSHEIERWRLFDREKFLAVIDKAGIQITLRNGAVSFIAAPDGTAR